ncbi:MAG: glycoside hydrolase family 99-like domain-containing protein [Thermoguttaceae bacterium]|jgi:hypothetical protein
MRLSHVSSFAALLNVALATFALCALPGSACAQDVKCADSDEKIEVVSYYFGNYHLDKRNEERLGKGWTEWELAKNAKPRFEGHQQPKVPLWGYTDEANPRDMEQKIDAAATYGIDVFLFDWYYYDDGPFLERTIDDGFLHAENRDKIKFALMWANHDWIDIFPKRKDVPSPLVYPGKVTPETFDKICDLVIEKYFKQPNYWKINGAPYFSIYELTKFGENFGSFEATKAAIERFREKTKAAGFPDLHLNAVYWGRPNIPGEGTIDDPVKLIEGLGFDSVTSYVWIHHVPLNEQQTDFNWVRDEYFKHWDRALDEFSIPYIPNVSMGWDSSPRACQDDPFGNWGYPFTNTISNNTPENFKTALQMTKDRILSDPRNPGIFNINCWNEWTEGSYLEPDTINGYKYLEAVRDVMK